jgi:hypothetical protein
LHSRGGIFIVLPARAAGNVGRTACSALSSSNSLMNFNRRRCISHVESHASFYFDCILQPQIRNATGFSNNSSGMTDAQQVSMKRFLIAVVILGAVVLFGIWYRRSDPSGPIAPTRQNNLIEDVNK